MHITGRTLASHPAVNGYMTTVGGRCNVSKVEEWEPPRYEKTGFLHMRKQRRRSASR